MPAARVARPAPVALKPPGLQSPAGLQRPAGQRVAVSPTRVTFQLKVAQNASPAGQPQQLANEEK